jgi:hypothetical protein
VSGQAFWELLISWSNSSKQQAISAAESWAFAAMAAFWSGTKNKWLAAQGYKLGESIKLGRQGRITQTHN